MPALPCRNGDVEGGQCSEILHDALIEQNADYHPPQRGTGSHRNADELICLGTYHSNTR